MTTKLTLSINEKTVQRAKRISRKRGKSISKMVEEYLNSIPEKEEDVSPFEKIRDRLKGKTTIPENIDYKEFIRESRYQDYLKELKNRSKK